MTLYWVWWTGNWSDATNHWATTSGGSPGAWNLPTATDDVVFDSLSNATSYTVTIDATTKLCRDITFWAPATWNVTLAGSVTMSVYWSMYLYNGMIITYTWLISFVNDSWIKTVTTNGVILKSNINISGTGWTIKLIDRLYTTWTFGHLGGTFDANNQNLIVNKFTSSTENVRTLIMGSGVWTITWAGTTFATPWDMQMNTTDDLTFDAWTSTIKFTNTTSTGIDAYMGELDYYNVWFSRWSSTGTISILFSSNSFNKIKDTWTAAHTLRFTTGTIQTVTEFDVSGTAGNLITINSTTTGTHTLTKVWSGTISSDYLNIQHSIVTPSNTWYAGDNSTNNQSVVTAWSGWIFSEPPAEPDVWTPRTQPDYEDNIFSTNIVPPNPRYYPFSTDIEPWEKWYFIFSANWNTPNWSPRT